MQDLGTLCAEGDCDSTAFDINDVGHIVGKSEIDPSVTHAFLYKNNQMVDLNSVLGASDQAPWELVEARAINEFGQIVGTGQFQGRSRAFLMTPPLSSIFDSLSQLVALVLSGQRLGTSQSLLAILQAAQEAIARGQSEVAVLQLNAYEEEVRALINGRPLTEIQGAKLLAGATLIRRVMEEERSEITARTGHKSRHHALGSERRLGGRPALIQPTEPPPCGSTLGLVATHPMGIW